MALVDVRAGIDCGVGGHHGFGGFRTFSHVKAVYQQARIDISKMSGMRALYGKMTEQSIKRMLRL